MVMDFDVGDSPNIEARVCAAPVMRTTTLSPSATMSSIEIDVARI
jgi:hypothetical protein